VTLGAEGERSADAQVEVAQGLEAWRRPARVGLAPARRSPSTTTLALMKPSRLMKLYRCGVYVLSRSASGRTGLCLSMSARYSATPGRVASS